MLPSLEDFKAHMRRLGLQHDAKIVLYTADPRTDLGAAARSQWMLRYYGASNVRILDGGLAKWIKEGRSTVAEDVAHVRPDSGQEAAGDGFRIVKEDKLIADVNRMHQVVYYMDNKATDYQIVDTRPEAVFYADGPGEGHVKGAINLPWQLLLADDGTMKTNGELAKVFTQKNVDTTQPTVHMCQKGIFTCVADLA